MKVYTLKKQLSYIYVGIIHNIQWELNQKQKVEVEK